MTFELISPAFAQGQSIPRKYTCDGNDISPPLGWSDPPPGTQGLRSSPMIRTRRWVLGYIGSFITSRLTAVTYQNGLLYPLAARRAGIVGSDWVMVAHVRPLEHIATSSNSMR